MKRTFWPTLHLWRVILFSVTRNEALLFGSASSELLLAQSYYWQGCSDLLNLSSLLAAAAPVVFEHEADLVALVE